MARGKPPAGHRKPRKKPARAFVESIRASLPMLRFWEAEDRLSVGMLIAANLMPLAGVFFAGWDAGELVLLYWTENVVVGFYNILKIAVAKGKDFEKRPAPKAFLIPFFCAHYGVFCFAHGFVVLAFISWSRFAHGGGPDPPLARLAGQMIWPISALFVSHGVSFVENTLIGGEYKTSIPGQQMVAPYLRLVVMHVAILFAGVFVLIARSPAPLLVLLVAGKIALDLVLHARSHRLSQAEAQE